MGIDRGPSQIALETVDGRLKNIMVNGAGPDIDLRPFILKPGLPVFPLVAIGMQVEQQGVTVLAEQVAAYQLKQFVEFPVFSDAYSMFFLRHFPFPYA